MQGPGVLIFGNLSAARREATIPTLANGTVTAPSIAFANETTTGVYYDDGFAISARGLPGIRVRASDGQFIAQDGYGIANINPANVIGLTTGFVGSNATFSGDVFVSGNLKVLGEANVVYGDEYVSNVLSITNYAPGPAARIRQFQTGPMMQMRDAANAVVFQVAANMVDFANLTISQKALTGSTIAKDLAVSNGGGNVFHVSSTGLVTLGNKISVMGSVDSGATRGISMWDASDTNWGMYMSQSGTGKSFSGGVAVPGADFAAHAMRFRGYDTATSGFVWENSSETRLMSLNSGTGHLDVAGNISAPFVFGNASQMTSVPLRGDATEISNVNAANVTGTFELDLNFVEGSLPANALYGDVTADVYIVPGTINANTDLSGTLPQSVLPVTIGNAATKFIGTTVTANVIAGNVTASSRIGIGTTTPATALDVQGSLRANGITKFGTGLMYLSGESAAGSQSTVTTGGPCYKEFAWDSPATVHAIATGGSDNYNGMALVGVSNKNATGKQGSALVNFHKTSGYALAFSVVNTIKSASLTTFTFAVGGTGLEVTTDSDCRVSYTIFGIM